jgi:hypothetical protein
MSYTHFKKISGKEGVYVGEKGKEKQISDQNGNLKNASSFIQGQRFVVQYPQVAAADVAKTFFIAPAACKVVSAYERHVTVAGQAGTLQIEKLNTGEAPGAGDVVLAAAFDLTSTANTPVKKDALATAAASLVAGDALCLKVASGAATSYALGTITVVMEWL